MTKKMGRYVERYNACQQYKNKTEILVEKLISNTILEKP